MRSHLIVIAAVGSVTLLAGLENSKTSVTDTDHQPGSISEKPSAMDWRITLQKSGGTCNFQRLPQLNAYGFRIKTDSNCAEFDGNLGNFATIKFVNSGDIELYGSDGKKIAQFMQGELNEHESIWPQYPHMALSRIDEPQ